MRVGDASISSYMPGMSKGKAIMAYGTEADRRRAAAMAELAGKSTSEWLLGLIRDNYRQVYGETPPESIHARNQRSAS